MTSACCWRAASWFRVSWHEPFGARQNASGIHGQCSRYVAPSSPCRKAGRCGALPAPRAPGSGAVWRRRPLELWLEPDSAPRVGCLSQFARERHLRQNQIHLWRTPLNLLHNNQEACRPLTSSDGTSQTTTASRQSNEREGRGWAGPRLQAVKHRLHIRERAHEAGGCEDGDQHARLPTCVRLRGRLWLDQALVVVRQMGRPHLGPFRRISAGVQQERRLPPPSQHA